MRERSKPPSWRDQLPLTVRAARKAHSPPIVALTAAAVAPRKVPKKEPPIKVNRMALGKDAAVQAM